MNKFLTCIAATACIMFLNSCRRENYKGTLASQKPNIVFIMADDLGFGELGVYGNTFNETPNLDKLASEGMRFKQAYAAAPVCSPTRGSIMTGQYPARVRITDFLAPHTGRLLDPDKYKTINEALSELGYHTGMIGKWHLDTEYKENKGGPHKHGFDEVIGTETKYIADGDYFFPYDKIGTFTEGEEGEFLTDRLAKEAVGFIERNKNKPFFLYLAHYSVHTKLDATPELVDKYKKKFDQKYGKGEAGRIFEGKNKRHEAKHIDNPYLAAMLEKIDDCVGSVMKALDENGVANNTLLIFFSDNGGAHRVANNGGLRMHKTWLYEGGIREPLIMRWPAAIKPGSVVETPVSSVDFYPTFLEAAGGAPAPGQIIDGVSLLPLIKGGAAPDRDELFWHYPSETGRWTNRMASAVRKGDFKLLEFFEDGRIELYNLKDDPFENENLVEKMPDKANELHTLLKAWRIEVNAEMPVIEKSEQ